MPNPALLKFSRSRATTVEEIDASTLRSTCRLTDTLSDMKVSLTVKLPDMEITDVEAEVFRTWDESENQALAKLPNVKGVRIGPGQTKILKGLVGQPADDSQLLFMVEEACHGVILTFTKGTLAMVPEDQELGSEAYREMVKANIRLYNRCAAFAPGSSLVEGIDPNGKES